MRVKSTIKIFNEKIRQITEAQIKALEKTGDWLRGEVRNAQVIPHDTGNLQNEQFSLDLTKSSTGRVSLIWNTPYARRLYYHPDYNFNRTVYEEERGGRRIRHEGNPNAQGGWMKDWLPGGSKEADVKNAYKKYLKEELRK